MDLIFETQGGSSFPIEVGYFDTVLEIKGKIKKYQHIPVPKQILVFQGNVLQDDHNIEQCDLFNNSLVHLFIFSLGYDDENRSNQEFKPEQPPQPISTKQQIINCHQDSSVMMSGTMLPMEVNEEGDTVGELKKELAKINQRFESNLPECYLFMCKQNEMEEDRSFLWNRVDHGVKIEIFSGIVPCVS